MCGYDDVTTTASITGRTTAKPLCCNTQYPTPRGGGLPQIHPMTLAPYSTPLTRGLFSPFPLAKIPSNYQKKSQITTPQLIFSDELVKSPPFFSRSHYPGQKHPYN